MLYIPQEFADIILIIVLIKNIENNQKGGEKYNNLKESIYWYR